MKQLTLVLALLVNVLALSTGQPIKIKLPTLHTEIQGACLTSDGAVVVAESDNSTGLKKLVLSKIRPLQTQRIIRDFPTGSRAIAADHKKGVFLVASNQSANNGLFELDFDNNGVSLKRDFTGFQDFNVPTFELSETDGAILIGTYALPDDQHKFAIKFNSTSFGWWHDSGHSYPANPPSYNGSYSAWSNISIVDSGYWFSGFDLRREFGFGKSYPHAIFYAINGTKLHEMQFTTTVNGSSFKDFYVDNQGLLANTDEALMTFDNQHQPALVKPHTLNSARLAQTESMAYLLAGYLDSTLYIQQLDRNTLSVIDSTKYALPQKIYRVLPLTHPKTKTFALLLTYHSNGASQNEVWLWPSGILNSVSTESVNHLDLKAFPIPAQHYLKLSGNYALGKSYWRIYDQLGVMRLDGQINQLLDAEINIESLATGIYFLHLDAADSKAIIKFVKSH